MTRCLGTGREGEGEGSQNKIENMQTNSNFLPCAEAHNPREARDRAAQTYDHKLSFDPYSQGAVPFRQRWANSIREVFSLQRVILQFT